MELVVSRPPDGTPPRTLLSGLWAVAASADLMWLWWRRFLTEPELGPDRTPIDLTPRNRWGWACAYLLALVVLVQGKIHEEDRLAWRTQLTRLQLANTRLERVIAQLERPWWKRR